MQVFNYEAIDRQGLRRKGTLEADSLQQARQLLRQRGLFPVTVTGLQRRAAEKTHWFRAALPLGELTLFIRQLHTLLESGTPLAQALKLLMNQYGKGRGYRLSAFLYEQIQQGTSFSQALEKAPFVLPSILVAASRAGEESGHLDQVLGQLADTLEQQEAMRKKLQAALIYPALMVVVAVAIIGFLMIYVVPKIVTVFDSMHQALPPLTQLLLSFSEFVQMHGAALAAVLMMGVGALWLAWRKPPGRAIMQRLLLNLPLVRALMLESAAARWTRTLGMLLKAGVPAVTAIKISNETLGILPLQRVAAPLAEQVAKGVPVSQAMESAGFFPPLILHLAASGEHNGQLPQMLLKGAQRYEQRVESLAQTLVALLEPVMIIIMGGIVLMIVLAIMLPIFSMNQMVGQ